MIEDVVRPRCLGAVALCRYADELTICCALSLDAERIRRVLVKRLAKFGLAINENKTRLVSFSRGQAQKGKRQGSFDFLGFSFYLGKARSGRYTPNLKTRAAGDCCYRLSRCASRPAARGGRLPSSD